jgi:methionine-rich copper-binding protein CopC
MTMKTKHLIPIAATLLASTVASSAWAHAKLQASEPKAGTTVAAAPTAIRLQFNETLELPFSKIKLVNAEEATIEPSAIALDKADPKAMVATVPALPAGPYRVLWSTMTRDGHKVKGEYSFTVK